MIEVNENKKQFIDKIIAKMTVEQKVGQCLVIGFVGTIITPEILRRIHNYYPAGIRAGLTFRVKTAMYDPTAVGGDRYAQRVVRQPKGTMKDFVDGIPVPHCSNEEYCSFLNTLKQEALDNGLGIPLHISLDMEGDFSADYQRGGIHYFPSCMGIGLTKDKQLAKDVAWAVARQVRALGFDWIHSPVLDVNTNPLNPEIGARAYSEDPEEVAEFGIAALEGFKKGGLIATGKHYPGRGESAMDAHDALPVIDVARKKFYDIHLYPFKRLVEAGIPAIMTAHTAYPSLDPSGEAASLSKTIITDILRNEFGFKGVITNDAITMGGIIQKYEVWEACVKSIQAGADLCLIRDESNLIDEIFENMVKAVHSGMLPEERLEESIRRTLSVKYDYGLFENGNIRDVNKASDGINDPRVKQIEIDASKRAVRILRDDQNILPLNPDQNILLVEQINPLHEMTNSQALHPSILWENMFQYKDDLPQVETTLQFTENDRQRVLARLKDADILVVTSYYYRNKAFNDEFVRELHKKGKPIVVITNTHYPTAIREEFKTVIVTYGVGVESMKAVAAKLFGGE